ncbi:MAG: flagellar biosynthesis protein FlgA [Planctomycetes bacterium HGW-Planctomycetes-1]|nr:MAG: flagellar biosynthesis protein FlgA [Planctomycetes bacterium HGW-Planctomycetes-1]
MKSRLTLLLIILLGTVQNAQCQRIKDIVDIQGIRGNPLTGVGLVVGLAGTGDSTLPAQQMLANILKDAGEVFKPTDLKGGNVALVVVTADLGPFARVGTEITATVSSLGDAKSLQGGRLLPTLLKGLDGRGLLDGQVYAIGQGGVSIAGWTAAGDKASITKNHQAAGEAVAIVEREQIATFIEYAANQRFITLNLRNVDFSTAEQISRTINQIYSHSAIAIDAGAVRVRIPDEISQKDVIGFIDNITRPHINVDVPAVVVVNERTGTIVVGENVCISSVAISQGSLTVKIREKDEVSQPTTPFTDGATTAITQATDISVSERDGYLIPIRKTVTVAELANTLNAIGATPTDLIAIFHALKRSGALQAKLEIM